MKKPNKTKNGVKGTSPSSGTPSPGKDSVGEQHRPGRHSATASTSSSTTGKRKKWTIEDNKEIMFCYYKAKPDEFGYRHRLYDIWQNRNKDAKITEQNLADRARHIQRKNYMTKVQLKEIKDLAEETIREQPAESSPDNDTEITTEEETSTSTVVHGLISQQNTPSVIPDTVDQETYENLKNHFEKLKITDAEIPNLKQLASRYEFKAIVQKANQAAEYISTNNITETMQLIKAVILTVTEASGIIVKESKPIKQKAKNMPPWKQRMNNALQNKRKELSQLVELKSKRLHNQKIIENLARIYNIKKGQIDEQIEILKQEILALKNKIERYSTRCEFYRQNKLFETNQKRFYDDLTRQKEEIPKRNASPNKMKVLNFWSNIWGNEEKHNVNAEWIKDVAEETNETVKQNDLKIKLEMLKKAIRKIKNWRAAGKDGIQGFWLKNLTSLHPRLVEQLQVVLDGNIPRWMTFGRTTLIIKNPDEPQKESNYRPITCLPTIWKLLTSIIADEIYLFLDTNKLIPWQQKGNKRKSHGTKDQLLIDKLITNLAKKKKRNLRMIWIDYKKAYDSVPHSWILRCLKIFHIADNIITFLETSMQSWQTILLLNQEIVGMISIKCGIFQGDSLSPILFILCLIPLTHLLNWNSFGFRVGKEIINHLLYMDDLKLYAKNDKEIDALVNTVRIFSKDINMEFGLEKCAKVTITRGKMESGTAIVLPDGREIKNLDLEEHYKYLGLMESDRLQSDCIKTKVRKEYKKRIRLILKSKLHGRHQIDAINSFALPVLTYPAGIIKYTQEEKRSLDNMTRKQMNMHGSLHPRADVDRLYVPRKSGGRGLLSVEDSINKEENSISQYIKTSTEPILKLTTEILLNKSPVPKETYTDNIRSKRMEAWSQKKLHGMWPKNLEKQSTQSNSWLQKSNLKPPTEALITAAQDQALLTKWHKTNITKTTTDPLCRRCGKFNETVAHIVSGCPELAQGVYLSRHNAVAGYIHWKLCKRENLPCSSSWYDHEPHKVVENENIKVLYDFTIRTDKKIEHRKPDLVIHRKREGKTIIVDFACPMDHNVETKEKEKIDHYTDLKFELEKIWKTRIKIIPIVIGALGTVTKNLEDHLKSIDMADVRVHQLQKCVLLKTGNLLRKHLCT